jgi:hypothetical protein
MPPAMPTASAPSAPPSPVGPAPTPSAAPFGPPGSAAGSQPAALGDQASDVARQAIESLGAQGRTVLSRLDPTGWRPTLAVGGILLAIVFGTQLVNAALPTPRPGNGNDPAPVPGTPVEVAPGVRIYPQPGWIQEAAGASRLRKGPIALDINLQSQPWSDPGTLYQAFVDQVLSQGATQLSATPGQVVQVRGGPAVQGTYVGTFQQVQQPVEGQVTAVIINGRAIVFDAWSVQGQLGQGLHEVSLMIGTVEVAP